MRKLIIDTMGLDAYERMDYTMDFYPGSLKGLIADYLAHYMASTGTNDADQLDAEFFNRVIQLYDNSPQARVDAIADANIGNVLVVLMVVAVSGGVQKIVQHSGEFLQHGIIDPAQMDWGQDYVLIPMKG